MIEQHITAKALADKLAVDPSTIQKMIGEGKITAVKLGRKFCIPQSAAEAYIASRTIHAKKKKTA